MESRTSRVAVVTGASSGIGAAIATELVKEGLIVVGIARRIERVQELSNELRGKKGTLYAVKGDIKNEKDIVRAFAWIAKNTSGVDILVNNAGIVRFDNLLEGSTDAWRQMAELNVLGLSICAREAVKSMKKKGSDDAIIINVNSVVGQRVLGPVFSMYSASKFAVTALSEALHKELTASGSRIRVTNLSPGAVNTELVTNPEALDSPASFKLPLDLNQILQPSDIADAVKFILSTNKRVHIPELTIQQNVIVNLDTMGK